jgi:hypothetical protein
MKEKPDLHGDCKVQLTEAMYQHAMARAAGYRRNLRDLKQNTFRSCISFRLGAENSSPPERTVCINASVAPLYLLLYSTVQNFSSLSLSSQGASEGFAVISSSVSGRRVSPSRSFAGHQSDRGRVRLDRWTVGWRRPLEEDADSFREVVMTFPPKNRRISASGLRCERETDNSLKHSSWGDREGSPFAFKVTGLARYVSRYLMG